MPAEGPPQEPPDDALARVRQRAETEPCPLCGAQRRIVRWFCQISAKDCFFVLSCEVCGDARLA